MGDKDREFGVVDDDGEEPLPDVAPETGIEPDDVAQAERSRTWADQKVRPCGDPVGGA
jgi:hypothetical protein